MTGLCQCCNSEGDLCNLDGFHGYMNLPATILNRNEHMQDLFNNYLMSTEKDYKIVFLYGLENLD